MASFFKLEHTDTQSRARPAPERCRARAGLVYTAHGVIPTPAFMPVGTQGAVKTLDQADLEQLGANIILGNTYRLHLRPGEDIVAEAGGLHRFIGWNKPILTDSGGFQVFSLGLQKTKNLKTVVNHHSFAKEGSASRPGEVSQGRLVKIDADGVTFTSHIDGSAHRFTPESAIDIQHKLGTDIIMAFDECTPDDAPDDYVLEALERTHGWAERSLAAHRATPLYHGYPQYLFGIIQGAKIRALRETSARFIAGLGFDGIAIGGESIGYNMEATKEILGWVWPLIPAEKPRYAMGIGLSPADLLVAIAHGVDMFDCVGPTRLARHGTVYINPNADNNPRNHRLNLRQSVFKNDSRPIDESCVCPTCQRYSRSYLHHLFAAGEITGLRLATLHNLRLVLALMREAREAILNNRFSALLNRWQTPTAN